MNIRVKYTREKNIPHGVHELELEEYLRCVVPVEMLVNWHMEAYKAQAVAARTFALRRINQPYSSKYDLDDTTKFQAYKINREMVETDQAVLATQGEVLHYDNELIRTCSYTSSNGGRTVSSKSRWGGDRPYLIQKLDPYDALTGRKLTGHGVGMSQYGAQEMAKQGKTYKEILAFYYTGCEVVKMEQIVDEPIEPVGIIDGIHVKYMTKNRCYIKGETIKPTAIMPHSTGCPASPASMWFDRWNYAQPEGKGKAVHAFLDDKEIWQYLPWTMRGWHAGGKANNTHIGFEICEPRTGLGDKEYFDKAYNKAIELCVILCNKFDISPDNIICHSEGKTLGIASNHSDVMHWFPIHGKDMDMFRQDVAALLVTEPVPEPEPIKPTPPQISQEIKNSLLKEAHQITNRLNEIINLLI